MQAASHTTVPSVRIFGWKTPVWLRVRGRGAAAGGCNAGLDSGDDRGEDEPPDAGDDRGEAEPPGLAPEPAGNGEAGGVGPCEAGPSVAGPGASEAVPGPGEEAAGPGEATTEVDAGDARARGRRGRCPRGGCRCSSRGLMGAARYACPCRRPTSRSRASVGACSSRSSRRAPHPTPAAWLGSNTGACATSTN